MFVKDNSAANSEKVSNDVVYLCKCALTGVTPDAAVIDAVDLDAVFKVASSHMIAAIVAIALQSAGYTDKRVAEVIASAQRKEVIFSHALASVKSGLEDVGIWYMPLKGAVLKDLYPKFGMREYADYDILYDASRAEDVKAIMEGFGFTTRHFGYGDHDIYYKPPVLNFEMHRRLFDPDYNERFFNYYKDVESRLVGDGLEKRFSDEDFYLYFLAHEYKHYNNGGTGLRSLMDTYVYLNAIELDMEYVNAEAEKLGLCEFEEKNRSLSLHLFDGGELTEDESKMLEYIMSSGAYGSFKHQVQNRIRKGGKSKLRYMLNRFTVPLSEKDKGYEESVRQYPFFYEHKILLPLLPIYRTIRGVKNGRLFVEAKALLESKGGADSE